MAHPLKLRDVQNHMIKHSQLIRASILFCSHAFLTRANCTLFFWAEPTAEGVNKLRGNKRSDQLKSGEHSENTEMKKGPTKRRGFTSKKQKTLICRYVIYIRPWFLIFLLIKKNHTSSTDYTCLQTIVSLFK